MGSGQRVFKQFLVGTGFTNECHIPEPTPELFVDSEYEQIKCIFNGVDAVVEQ